MYLGAIKSSETIIGSSRKTNWETGKMYLPKEYDQLEQYCKNQMETVYIDRIRSEKDNICGELQAVWADFCAELTQGGCKPEYVEISLLRHSLLGDEDIPAFLFEAFDERWLFGGLIHTKRVSLPALSSILTSFRKAAYSKAKRYVGKIARSLAKKAYLLQLPEIETHISDLLKENTDTWLTAPAFHTLFRPEFQCSFGGYRFFQNTLYEVG